MTKRASGSWMYDLVARLGRRSAAICSFCIAVAINSPLHAAEWDIRLTDVQSTPSVAVVEPRTPVRRAGEDTITLNEASTGLVGLSRFTCGLDGVFLPEECQEELFPPCNENTIDPIALTTDHFVALSITIADAEDGESWQWSLISPESLSVVQSLTLIFFSEFQGLEECFVYFRGFGSTLAICGSTSLSPAGVGFNKGHYEDTPGLWEIDLTHNGQLLFPALFEIVEPPVLEIVGFDEAQLGVGELKLTYDLTVSNDDEGPWNALVRVGTSPTELSSGTEILVEPGSDQQFSINLPAEGIPRFDDDIILTIDTSTSSEDNTGPEACVLAQSDVTLAIPLPILFVHGYIPTDNFLTSEGSTYKREIFRRGIEPIQKDPLFDYLVTNSEVPPKTSDLRIPYQRSDDSASVYPTLRGLDWIEDADKNAGIVGNKIRIEAEDMLTFSYATQVNIISHSAGGLAARHALNSAAPVNKLIMVGSPNNGLSAAYLATSGYSFNDVRRLMLGFAGSLIPRDDIFPYNTRGPYLNQKGKVCELAPDLPLLQRIIINDFPLAQVEVFNIFTKKTTNKGEDAATTPWDIMLKPDGDWFTFKPRPFKKANLCTFNGIPLPLASLRSGDGYVSVDDARLGVGDIPIESNVSHVKQLNDPKVRTEIIRALGLIE